ncbi:transcription termination factor Rho [Corynebacterium uropygiale]|uniref:Transcription termination factor Rho n=1 Tax=Corynebacterium uropygiale TaxID=1775911 RepID=A0A9X1TZI9_9CORY|nr:transcription termination factor Rho [Corynebacterium uropygiale]
MTEKDTAANGGEQQNLASLRIPELRQLAAQRGIKGIYGLRKGELIAAIEGASPAEAPRGTTPQPEKAQEAPAQPEKDSENAQDSDATDTSVAAEGTSSEEQEDERPKRHESRSAARRARRNRARQHHREQKEEREREKREKKEEREREKREHAEQGENAERQDRNGEDENGRRGRRNRRNRRSRDNRDNREQRDQRDSSDERDDRGNQNGDRQDNVQEVAGILDIVDNNMAFVRTTGYHAAPTDVYVNNQLIRRCGLRAGDYITGTVRMNRGGGGGYHGKGGRGRNRYNNLIHVDTVNNMSVEEARQRPRFAKLTPLYPNQRLRLETEPKILTTRVIDLIMPIGKGQRALIVSPPKAGKTTILQNIANAITTNNPECYLMVVLVDERPEEVTDMERSVRGEVISSTFDRPPSEHTSVAELAIERAKRLVEQGQDVVVLLDSITRLGRAYNNSSPASGRILSGGVDSNALYPPKRFLGAARNIENGGSLTIIATAMVETGSAGDTVIFEEFKGTGNAELKLDRKISERRVFPAVDVNPSGTRKDELLLAPEEARVMHKLRRILSALDNQQAIDLLIKQLKKTRSNGEFLMQVAKSAPMAAAIEEEDYS